MSIGNHEFRITALERTVAQLQRSPLSEEQVNALTQAMCAARNGWTHPMLLEELRSVFLRKEGDDNGHGNTQPRPDSPARDDSAKVDPATAPGPGESLDEMRRRLQLQIKVDSGAASKYPQVTPDPVPTEEDRNCAGEVVCEYHSGVPAGHIIAKYRASHVAKERARIAAAIMQYVPESTPKGDPQRHANPDYALGLLTGAMAMECKLRQTAELVAFEANQRAENALAALRADRDRLREALDKLRAEAHSAISYVGSANYPERRLAAKKMVEKVFSDALAGRTEG